MREECVREDASLVFSQSHLEKLREQRRGNKRNASGLFLGSFIAEKRRKWPNGWGTNETAQLYESVWIVTYGETASKLPFTQDGRSPGWAPMYFFKGMWRKPSEKRFYSLMGLKCSFWGHHKDQIQTSVQSRIWGRTLMDLKCSAIFFRYPVFHIERGSPWTLRFSGLIFFLRALIFPVENVPNRSLFVRGVCRHRSRRFIRRRKSTNAVVAPVPSA